MNNKAFIEEVYEIAFGDNAINRDFSPEEVIKELQSFSNKALAYDVGFAEENYNTLKSLDPRASNEE